MVQSAGLPKELQLKTHIRIYFSALAAPFLIQLGASTKFFEESQFFAEDGWWKSLTAEQQVQVVIVGWVIWVVAVTVAALVLSCFSYRWQQRIWEPLLRRVRAAPSLLRKVVSQLGLRLVSADDLDRIANQKIEARAEKVAAAGPPKGQASSRAPGLTLYGELSTRRNLNDSSLTVSWRTTRVVIGQLMPARGGKWEVHYGRREGKADPYFVSEQNLGLVQQAWEGVERLRLHDLQESGFSTGNSAALDGL